MRGCGSSASTFLKSSIQDRRHNTERRHTAQFHSYFNMCLGERQNLFKAWQLKKEKKQHGQHMIHVELNLSGIFSGSLCCRNTFPCSNKCSLNATFIFPCRRLQIIKRRLKCAGCSVSEGIKQTHRSIFDSVQNVHSITCQPSPRSITLGFFLSTLVSYLFGWKGEAGRWKYWSWELPSPWSRRENEP